MAAWQEWSEKQKGEMTTQRQETQDGENNKRKKQKSKWQTEIEVKRIGSGRIKCEDL